MSRDRRCCLLFDPLPLSPTLSLPLAPAQPPAHKSQVQILQRGSRVARTSPFISKSNGRPDANHRLRGKEERILRATPLDRSVSTPPPRRAVPRGRREGRAQQSSRQSRAIPPSLARLRRSCATVLPPLSNFCRRLLLHFCCRARAPSPNSRLREAELLLPLSGSVTACSKVLSQVSLI